MLHRICQSRFLLPSSVTLSKRIDVHRSIQQRFFSQSVLETPENEIHRLDRMTQAIRPHLPSIAQKMLDDRLLHKLQTDGSFLNRDIILRSYLELCETAEERHETVVSFSLLQNHQWLFENACDKCLYSKTKCVCPYIKRTSPRHNLWVFQHHCEYGRANNTGSLLCIVADAARTIRGLRDQEQRLLNHVAAREHSVAVLFPTDDSLTVDEYTSQRAAKIGSRAESEPLTLILLDGTSRQAKNLDRFMPSSLPRICIGKASIKSWLDPIRKQTEKHRVCTAQAAAIILQELGDVKTSKVIENAVQQVVRISCSRRAQYLKKSAGAVLGRKD